MDEINCSNCALKNKILCLRFFVCLFVFMPLGAV